MDEEVLTLVRIPVKEIEQMVRAKHVLPNTVVDVRLEPDFLILYFADKESVNYLETSSNQPQSITVAKEPRRRRARRKRNRMRTRGWDIVARMTNQKGQSCAIYAPFIKALSQPLSTIEQRSAVARILRSNGNRPSEESISYFLENTLEYLKSQEKQEQAGLTT